MKFKTILSAVAVGTVLFYGCNKDDSSNLVSNDENQVVAESQESPIIKGHYVVVLNENSTSFKSASEANYQERVNDVKVFAKSMLSKEGISNYEIENGYAEALKGFSVRLSEEDAAKLEKDSRVKYILPDRMYIMKKPGTNPSDPPASQQVPYGIQRVGYGSGVGKTAWIIDTGIDLDHPDLNVDQTRGRNFISTTRTPDDDNGHGSHCAGIVAAINNSIGVVGVAAGATVVPIKVLDRRGSGAYSVIIAGVDYVASAAASGDAANMSLGGGVYQAIDDAVYAASQKGINFALAAGNESDDANNHSPARVNGPHIWTISAMDSADKFAYFSNYGNPPVDYCEPGVNIYSTYKGGGYTTMSGTSMAAPHMCGILLMTNGNPRTDGYVISDPDGKADPIGTI